MAFLRKDFRNGIENGLGNILKYNYKCILIANTLINSNRSFNESYFDYQRITNLKDRAFRMLRNLIIIG
jgi:hypothetical protein